MPLLSGPGSIAVTISMATHASDPLDYLPVALGIVIVAIICFGILRSASWVVEYFSETAINAMTRLMGFLLVCIGIQFVLTGLVEGFSTPEIIAPVVEAFRAAGSN